MKKKTVLLSLLTLSAVVSAAALFMHSTSAFTFGGPSSNGHGTLTLPDGHKRQFSFNARLNADGTASGHAIIHNPNFDFRAHLDITCLQVVGNRASFGGAVRNSTDPAFEGQNGFFTVFDNGEPGKDSDTISLVFFDPITADACLGIGPNDFDQMPIDGGNIQVKQ